LDLNIKKTVELIERDVPFQGYFRVARYRLKHGLFNGEMGPEIIREVFERGHAACVIPYDPVRDHVVLIEQFRPGAYAAGDADPWMIEVVAGIIDPGETPEDVCRRESVEEANLHLGTIHHLGTQYMTPGGSSESIAMYVASCDSRDANGVYGLADEGEDIRVYSVPREEALNLVYSNQIRNAMTTVALLLFEQKRPSLHFD